MTYNFETIGKRYHTGSKKWSELLANGVKESEDIIPFSVADMEFETAPEIVSALKEELDRYVLGYANPTEEYLNVVCRWMKERHGWDAKPEWILPAAGERRSRVFKTTCFLAHMEDFAEFNDVYAHDFTSNPARSCVAVKKLPKGALCEIEAIAQA